jgi:hypothetical protein
MRGAVVRGHRSVGANAGPLPVGAGDRVDRPSRRHPSRQAEAAAGVEKLEGGLWHAYRRKWATERKELPLKDVAAAGGWKDVTTLLTCYQHAEEATMLKVMASPAKLVGRRTAGAVEKL